MEVNIKFKTPGHYLSMHSMFGVISLVRREIQIAVSEVLFEEFPSSNRELIRKQVKRKIDLSLKDAKKGSWEVFLVGTCGAAIGAIVTNLLSDIITNTENWKKFRNSIYSISEMATHRAKTRLAKKKKIGPFEAKYKLINASKKKNGVPVLDVDIELFHEGDEDINFDMEEEVNRLIEELQSKHKK